MNDSNPGDPPKNIAEPNSPSVPAESGKTGPERSAATPATNGAIRGTPLSADDVTLLGRFREKFLPDTRIAASDAFAKWLFGLTATVATLGAAFSNAAFSQLKGFGIFAYGTAILLAGAGLAVATYALSIDMPDANWQSLEEMFSELKNPVRKKRYALRAASLLLALALAAAASAPLLSLKVQDMPVEPSGLKYSITANAVEATLIKDGLRPGSQLSLTILGVDQANKAALLAGAQEIVDLKGRVVVKIPKSAIPGEDMSLSLVTEYDGQSRPEEVVQVILKSRDSAQKSPAK
jgi:hypothetical protein